MDLKWFWIGLGVGAIAAYMRVKSAPTAATGNTKLGGM